MRKIALINLSYLHSENNNISNDSEHSARRVSAVGGDVTASSPSRTPSEDAGSVLHFHQTRK